VPKIRSKHLIITLVLVVAFSGAILVIIELQRSNVESSVALTSTNTTINPITTTMTTTTSAQNQSQNLSQMGFQFWNQSGTTWICMTAITIDREHANPISLPVKFNMSTAPTQGCYTLRRPYFGALLDANISYLVNITSTAPVNFTLLKATGNDPSQLYSETYNARTVMRELRITFFNRNITINEDGLYIFVLNVEEPMPIATVYFSVRPTNLIIGTTSTTSITSYMTLTTTSTNKTTTITLVDPAIDSSFIAWVPLIVVMVVVVVFFLFLRTRHP